ncbi:hypothetical protein JHK85_009887 [Glycine max]|nr:hypothetical protein JHK85_009887 [Glycine max]
MEKMLGQERNGTRDLSNALLGAMALSEHAEMSDIESDSSLDQSNSIGYEEEEESQGIGILESTNLQTGITGQGMLDPIAVKSRGGKRKREKKFAKANRATKEDEESPSDVFALINNHLALHNKAFGGGSMKKRQSKASEEGKKVDRRALVAYEEKVKDLKIRVEKLEHIVNANRKEKAMYKGAMRKLNETRKPLAYAEEVHASASNLVTSKEKEKRWLMF